MKRSMATGFFYRIFFVFLWKTRNMASMAGDDDCLSQLSSAPLGWNDLEQLHAVAMADVTSPTGNT